MKLERTGFALVLAAPFALWAAPARSDPDAADAVGGKGAGDAADGDDLSRDALAILAKRCAGCHGGPSQGVDADRGGFEHVLDVRELVADGQVVPYAPDESLLLARLVDGEMPPKEVADRPTDAEIATLRAWIAGGARPPRAETSGDVAERVFVTDGDVDRWIAADLAAASRRERRHYRYVGFVHLYDAGVSDDELDLARQALAKLVNSLSWKPEVSVPVAVDERHIVYRLDLRELGWTRALWTEISELDPYAVVRTSADARAAYAATGTFVPYVRGDWLVATASRPPLYHRILAVPGNARALQARLGVDLAGDVAAGRAARAGFNGSGVSQHNRVIERHDADGGGYYWQSFDFANSSGRHNIFEHPLTYSHDGSEIIFSLPNGLQGYMLTDAAGDRIDRALTTIVTDPSRADRTVENGISCMGCHAAGLIRKDDQVRPHLEANRAAFASQTVTDALALYRARDELVASIVSDRRGFERALAAAGVTAGVEPINFLTANFEAELAGSRVAAELGLEIEALAAALERAPALRRTLGAVLVSGGSVKREVFVGAFASAVRGLDLGTPYADVPRADHIELRCLSGTAKACYRAGTAFYDADGVARDYARALAMYIRACKADHGAGCTAAGLLYTTGRGATADDGRAARYFGRACELGHARGCHRIGHLYFAGRGVSRRTDYAAAYFERACTGGRADSCRFLGDMKYHGSGIAADRAGALELYDKGCDAGSARACSHAGYMYDEGSGVVRDRSSAARYYARACEGDDGASCRRLAIQYRWGQGVEPDWIVSERLFRRACKLGVDTACLYL